MKKIRFTESTHKYWYGRKQLTSVTTYIGKFFPPFEGKVLAKRLASYPFYKKQKKGMRKIMAEWKASASHGTRVHQAIEEYINCGDALYCLDKFCTEDRDFNKFNQWLQWYEPFEKKIMSNEFGTIQPEVIVHNEEYGLAGTIDLIVTYKNNEGNVVTMLLDWKTNTNFKKNYAGNTAFKPINHLPNTKLSKYTLQLSLYAYMLEQKGSTIGDLMLVEIGEDRVKEWTIPYSKKEIEVMLKW